MSPPARTADVVRRVSRLARRGHYPEVVGSIVCLIAIGLGVAMIADADAFRRPTFASALAVASPQAWGVSFVVTGSVTAAAVALHRHVAMWPALILTGLWGTWSACMVISAGAGVPSAAVVYTGLAWLTLSLAAVYWTDGRSDHEPQP